MLKDVLESRVDELRSMVADSRGATAQLRDLDLLMKVESTTMLMDGVMDCIRQLYTEVGGNNKNTVLGMTERADKILWELKHSVLEEIGGEFAQELGEMCDFVGEKLHQVLSEPRKVLLDMAAAVMGQMIQVWEYGMRYFLLSSHLEEQKGIFRSKLVTTTVSDSPFIH